MTTHAMHIARAVAGAVLLTIVGTVEPGGWIGLGPSSLTAQDQPARPPSAALLRRIASSADAFRNDDSVYVVASHLFPHEVIDVYDNLRDARTAALEAGPDFDVFGPIVTPADFGLPLAVVACYKDDITTKYVCPPIVGPDIPVFRMSEVDSVRLTIFSNVRGPVWVTVRPPPSEFILSLDAFDRFIAPYYLHLFGPDVVAQMRQEMIDYIRRGLGIR